MQRWVLLLICLICTCYGRRVQSRQIEGEFLHFQSVAELDETSTPSETMGTRIAVETLKDDLLHILEKEPHWNIFAEEFQLIDQSGGILLGLQPLSLLFNLLRGMRAQLAVKDMQIWFTEKQWASSFWENGKFHGDSYEPFDAFLVVDWRIQLQCEGSSGNAHVKVVLEAETIFHFNDDLKVDYMWIKECFANDQALLLWPGVDLSDSVASNLVILQGWLEAIQEQTSSAFEFATSDHGYRPTSDVGEVLRTLRADIPLILEKEPNWDIFAEDFKLIDNSTSGVALLGLEPKLLLRLLRRLPEVIDVDEFQVQFMEINWMHSAWHNGKLRSQFQEPSQPLVAARWRVLIDKKGSMLDLWRTDDDPVEIMADMSFHLNIENRLVSAHIEAVSVNGFELLAWPDVNLLDRADANLEIIAEWIEEIKEQTADLEYDGHDDDQQLTLDRLDEILRELSSRGVRADEETIHELLKGLVSGELSFDEASINEILRELQAGDVAPTRGVNSTQEVL